MKHLKQFLLVLIVAAVCSVQQIFAQQMPTIPIDQNVRIGKLNNGLTYYIRKNSIPANRAFFYIAQKAGSILEQPEQRGLAHFLEHMCFNGTKHFPGDALKQYLEKIGVKFGENLNAYTSIDETVYNIDNVPVTVAGAVDSCLLILHDWSNDLTLDPVEIDKERGVIHEEWRMRNSADQRLQEKMMPLIMADSKYADCMPIGSMDIVMNFKPQVLRDYYEKWYRPDMQGIIVVGDVDVDQVEAKIKEMFADIPAQPNAAKRIYYPVPDNKEPIVFIGSDKEATSTQGILFFKHDAVPDSAKTSLAYLIQDYATTMVDNMLRARYEEILQKQNPPFTEASVYDGEYFVAKTKDAFTGYAVCREGNGEIEKGISALLREILRAKQFGFTDTEYNRARAEYLRRLESQYNDRAKQESSKFVQSYVRNFLENEPIPGIEKEYTMMSSIAPKIPAAAINQMLPELVSDSDMVVVLTAPEKAGLTLPTKENLLNAINEVKAEKLTAYVDKVSNEPLIATKPKAGKVVSEKKDPEFGTTEMVLSNGAKVIIKKTDFKADEIRMNAISKGGTSLYPTTDIINLKNLSDVAGIGGIGNFSTTDLQKQLAGKKANASASVSLTSESVKGSCSPKDFETLMQLTYLTFTSPRKDPDAFASFITRTKADLKNQEMEPQTAFSDTLMKAIYLNNPRVMRMKENMVDKINYDRILNIYKDRFKNAGDFTFIFVGNANADSLKPMIEQYIGSLPSNKTRENYKIVDINTRKGIYNNNFIKAQQTPKSDIFILLSGATKYDLKNMLLADMLGQILDITYTQTIREDQGGAYSVGVFGQTDFYPKGETKLIISFSTDPGKRDKMKKITLVGLNDLIKDGPSQKNLDKVKEFMLKKHAESVKENSYWMSAITDKWLTGVDTNKDYDLIVKSITTNDIKSFADALYNQNNRIEVTMSTPDKK